MRILSKILRFSWQEQIQKIKIFKYYTEKDKKNIWTKLSSLRQEHTFKNKTSNYQNYPYLELCKPCLNSQSGVVFKSNSCKELAIYLDICAEAWNWSNASNIFLPSSSSLLTLRYLLVSGIFSRQISTSGFWFLGISESCQILDSLLLITSYLQEFYLC